MSDTRSHCNNPSAYYSNTRNSRPCPPPQHDPCPPQPCPCPEPVRPKKVVKSKKPTIWYPIKK